MEPARHPALKALAPRRAGPRVAPEKIPTLEIEVAAAEIPTLETPVDVVREVGYEPVSGRWAPAMPSRGRSRSMIAAAAFGLLLIMSILSGVEMIVAGGTDSGRSNVVTTQRDGRPMPTLVLLGESLRAPTSPPTSWQLLESTAELLNTRDLHDQATVDFAMQSLQTLMLTHPDNRVPRRHLETLTRRLADEARIQWEQGSRPLAKRLLKQASNSGVASEYVGLVADYISTSAADSMSAADNPSPRRASD